MAKRAKEKIVEVYTPPTNPILRSLQERKPVPNKEREARMREIVDEHEQLDNVWPRGKYLRGISSGIGCSVIDAAWRTQRATDKELQEAASEAAQMYSETLRGLDFGSSLNREQVATLMPVLNNKVFAEPLSVDDMLSLLECRHTHPVKIKNNGLLSYFFKLLWKEGWICQNWQMVAETKKVFIGSRGAILTQKSLGNAPTKYCQARGIETNSILDEAIYSAVKGLKR